MVNIAAMRKKLAQLEAEKSSILAKVSETSRKNASARKYAIGGALIKLASTDSKAYSVLKQVWTMSQNDKPRAFDGEQIPAPPLQQASLKES